MTVDPERTMSTASSEGTERKMTETTLKKRMLALLGTAAVASLALTACEDDEPSPGEQLDDAIEDLDNVDLDEKADEMQNELEEGL